MKFSQKMHTRLRLQNLVFTILFLVVIGLLAWLSTRYSVESDWTAAGRNSLSEASRKVLRLLDDKVEITAFVLEDDVRRDRIRHLVERYRRHKTDISLELVNPDTAPDRAQALGISRNGELAVTYRGRREIIQEVSESTLTNTLMRLARQGERWVTFLSGHGERRPHGQADRDLGRFGGELARHGVNAQEFNLAALPDIPANTSVLVVASPQRTLLPGELRVLLDFIDHGGNLLWLTEPHSDANLDALAGRLELHPLPGVVVDATTQLYAIEDPTFALVSEYGGHAITEEFASITVFPLVQALESLGGADFRHEPILTTARRAWTETAPIAGKIRFNAEGGEREGPLHIGFALTRTIHADGEKRQQRIAVIGDGDFLSNAYLGNGGNLDLGLNLIRWLSHDDRFISIPAKTVPDPTLQLSPLAVGVIGFGFLVILPLALTGCGTVIWFRRRRR